MSDTANNDNTPNTKTSENPLNPPYQGDSQEPASEQNTKADPEKDIDAAKEGSLPYLKGGLGWVCTQETFIENPPSATEYILIYGLFTLWGVALGLLFGWLIWA